MLDKNKHDEKNQFKIILLKRKNNFRNDQTTIAMFNIDNLIKKNY